MEIIKKIKSLFEDNQKLIYAVAVILSLVLAGYYIYISFARKDTTPTYVSALGNEFEKNNGWDNVTINPGYKDYSGEYDVYSIKLHTLDKVYSLLSGIGFDPSSFSKTDGLYYWDFGNDGSAVYVVNKALFGLTTNKLSYKNIFGSFMYKENIENYLTSFIKEFFGVEQKIAFDIDESDGKYYARGHFIFDGIDAVDSQAEEFQISIVFDSKGKILDISVPLVSFSRLEKVDIVGFNEVTPYLSNPYYPKESVVTVVNSECEDGTVAGCYADNLDITNFKSAEISEVILVYRIDISETKTVVPVYVLSGTGKYFDQQSKMYPVNVKLILNALDPRYVVIK